MKDKKAIGLFLIITFTLSAICYYIRIKGGDAAAGMTQILMWCPAVAAFIVRGVYYRREKLLGWNRCKPIYILIGLFVPVIYSGLSYSSFWVFNKGSLTVGTFPKSAVMLVILFVSSIILAAGEEIGWRGFLLPRMAEVWNVKTAVIVSGLIWALWHFPLMLAGLYNEGTPLWYQLPVFTVEIVAITAIMAVVRLGSKSVWPAIILHASHNYFDQTIFAPLTGGVKSVYFVGETGIITAVLLVSTALFMVWKSGYGKTAINPNIQS